MGIGKGSDQGEGCNIELADSPALTGHDGHESRQDLAPPLGWGDLEGLGWGWVCRGALWGLGPAVYNY